MSRAQSKAQYKGLDHHLHVTVTKQQRAKLDRLVKRTGVTLGAIVRGLIDDMEAK